MSEGTAPAGSRRAGGQAGGLRAALMVMVALLAAACSAPPPGAGEFHDPYEARNREIHAANRALDAALLRRSSGAYGRLVPEGLREAVSNFAANLDQPLAVANNLLQARPGNALHNGLRFAVNSTFGIGGLFDVAAEMGLHPRPTDFGETLHVWGVGEGAYLEVPLLGPSTERDFAGSVVDYLANPVRLAVPREHRIWVTAAGVASRFGDRYRYSDFLEETLYRSADSYAQARLLYLQNRRFRLGDTERTEVFDPYEDLLPE